MKKEITMELFKARHTLPKEVDGAVFETEVDPTNTGLIEAIAERSIYELCESKGFTETVIVTDEDDKDCYYRQIQSGVQLNLYVTGLTVALVAVLNVCRKDGITVTLWHYDRATGEYYPQPVV